MSEPAPGTSRRLNSVLIVDDDPVLVAIAEMFFQKRDVPSIHTAVNGQQGLDIVDRLGAAIDLILCDLNMPELDGIQFLRHLRDRNFRGAVAILSGEQAAVVKTAKSLALAHNLNVVGTIGKPVKLNELERLIGGLVEPAAAAEPSVPVLATVHDLRHALTAGDVRPYYQPKVCVKSGKVCGAEALARWLHPKLGVIGPNFFIPMAEQNDLIFTLTMHMIDASFRDMVTWRQHNVAPKVSVNLGAETLGRLGFPDEMAARTAAAGIEPSSIVFEITERQLAQNTTTASEILARLRILGFGISIDDFGTGYSNIEQLREYPFSELKIDQSFIRSAAGDQFARTTVEACTKIGKQLGLTLVAEGVETVDDWNFVARADIDEVQGYYVAKPMPAAEFADWTIEYERRRRPQAHRPLRQNSLG